MRDLSSVKVTPGRQIPRLKKNFFLCFSWLFIFLDFRDTHSSIQITQHKSSSDSSIDVYSSTLKTNLHGIECEASVMWNVWSPYIPAIIPIEWYNQTLHSAHNQKFFVFVFLSLCVSVYNSQPGVFFSYIFFIMKWRSTFHDRQDPEARLVHKTLKNNNSVITFFGRERIF